jgi:hypothetical protein
MMRRLLLLFVWAPLTLVAATPSEITVDLKLKNGDYVSGEQIVGVVNVVNVSPETVVVGRSEASDRFFVEVFRAGDRSQMERSGQRPFVAPFFLKPNEGQKLETRLGDHYGLRTPGRYLARPVLVHGGVRYEGQMRAFDVVPGMKMTQALQMFANRDGLRRELTLVSWSRGGREHLFLTARDMGASERRWLTVDLGEMMKITKPTISVMPTGEVIILHRFDPDHLLRSEFWSVPDALEFNRRELLLDPETAGSRRVREIYEESGGIAPKENPWWKFW